MKRLGLSLLVSVAFSTAWGAELNMRLTDFEQGLERRSREALNGILPPSIKPIVTVHAIEAEPAPAALGKEKGLEVGYVPIPLIEDPASPSSDAPKRLQLGKVEILATLPVRVAIDSTEAKAWVAASQELLTKTFAAYQPTVQVNAVAAQADTATGETAEPPYKEIAMALIALGVAMIVALGIRTVAQALKSASASISSGFLQLKTQEMEAKNPAPPPEKEEKTKPAEGPSLGAPAVDMHEVENCVQVLRTLVRTDATVLARSVQDSEADYRGLTRLLPGLDEDERNLLKSAMGTFRIEALASHKETAKGEYSAQEFATWIQNVAERAVLRRVNGGSPVEQALGAERVKKLLSAPPEKLAKLARESAVPAAWRIAAELLPPSLLAKTLENSDPNEWRLVVSSADASLEELVASADELTSRLDNASGSEGPGAQDKSKFYASYLLRPLVESVSKKPMTESDQVLEQIASYSTELGELLKKEIWTPKELGRVPEPYLAKQIKVMNNDDRVALILSLPKNESERVRALVPEGNARTIVFDKVQKAVAKNDAEQMKKAAITTRRFLDALRREVNAGRLQLLEEGAPVIPLNAQNTRTDTGATQAAA